MVNTRKSNKQQQRQKKQLKGQFQGKKETYEAWVRFRIWVQVQVQDSAILKKQGASAAIKKLLKIFLYSELNIFYIKKFK